MVAEHYLPWRGYCVRLVIGIAAIYYVIFGTCDDDADTTVAGVLEVLTEAVWNERRVAEHEATKPYPSWIGYLDTMTWSAPVARPVDAILNGGNVRYQWDEATLSWVPQA